MVYMKLARLGKTTSKVKRRPPIVRKPAIKTWNSDMHLNGDRADEVWSFVPFFWPQCFFVIGCLQFLPIADADNTPTRIYADEEQRPLRTHGCGADAVGAPFLGVRPLSGRCAKNPQTR